MRSVKRGRAQRYLSVFCLLLSFVLLVWGGILLWRFFHAEQRFPIRRIKVVMVAEHLSAEELAKQVASHLRGGFFSLNVDDLRLQLLKNPWIVDVAFRRNWPSTLEVRAQEQKPLARWGKHQLINANGQIFTPPKNTLPSGLVKLSGPQQAVSLVLAQYQQVQARLARKGIYLTAFSLDDHHVWRFAVDNRLTVVLGERDLMPRLEKFTRLFSQSLVRSKKSVIQVDLRYPNGAAVHFSK